MWQGRSTNTKFFRDALTLLGLAANGNQNLQVIQGYNLIQILGTGGFGEVYLAQHQASGKFIALKVMLPAIAANENAVQRFLRETENTKALQHPNVVQVIDYGFFEGIFFFTMEYCSGGTVWDLMQQQGGKLAVDIALSSWVELKQTRSRVSTTR